MLQETQPKSATPASPRRPELAKLLDEARAARKRGDKPAALGLLEEIIGVDPRHIAAQVETGQILRDLKRNDDALAAFRRALEIDPKYIAALIGVGQVLRQQGDRNASLAAFEAAAATDPKHFGVRMEVAYDLRELGRLEEAKAAFQRAAEINPNYAPAWIGVGSILRLTDRDASLAAYEAAVAADPTHLGARMEVAYDLRELGRLDDAEAAFERALEINPKHVSVLMNLASLQRRRGDRNASLETYKAAADADPAHAGARIEVGNDLRELGRLDEAEAAFRGVLADQPKHVGALLALGRLLRQRDRWPDALAAFEAAVEADPSYTNAKIEAANALREIGRRDDAEAMYRRVLTAEPQHSGALLGLGSLLMEQHRLDDAEKMFQDTAKLDGKSLQGLMALGLLARRRRDRAASLRYYEAATAADPLHAGAKLEFAAELRDHGDYQRAHDIINSVLKAEPHNLQALMHRGQVYRREGDHHAALRAFEEAFSRHPEHIQALVDTAVEHLGLGNPDEAERLLVRALDLDPKHLGALMQGADNAWIADDSERCLDLCLRAIAAHPRSMRAYLIASRAAADLGNRDDAEELLAQAIDKFGRHPSIEARRIEMARQARRWDTARALLGETGDAAKTNFPLWVQALQLAMNTGEHATVEDLLRNSPASSTIELAQANVFRGQQAEARWRFDEAIEHYRAALALNPYHTTIHSEMARACLLHLDLDAAAEHLRIAMKLRTSRNLLKGWSLNISQNSLGQIFDEFALDRALIDELKKARTLPLGEQLGPLQHIVRANPDNTAAALTLIIAMRQSRLFSDKAVVSDPARVRPIPRRIVQFWDAADPPADIRELTASWTAAHPDFEHILFNDETARNFLQSRFSNQVVRAFLRARHPAQRADIFRLAYLAANGGFYADADDRCNTRIDSFVSPDAALVLYQENYGTIGNNFMGAMPGHPMLMHALRLGVEAINRGDNDILWLCTGPGLLTRAFAQLVSGIVPSAGDWKNGTAVFELGRIQRQIGFHCRVNYKKTDKHWSHASFRRNTRREAAARA